MHLNLIINQFPHWTWSHNLFIRQVVVTLHGVLSGSRDRTNFPFRLYYTSRINYLQPQTQNTFMVYSKKYTPTN